MRWFTTLFLILLVVLGGAVLFLSDQVLVPLGLKKSPTPTPQSVQLLETLQNESQFTRVDVIASNQTRLTLLKQADGTWQQPGGWALRSVEVQELLNTITHLKTRFVPQPANTPNDYGLSPEQSPIIVEISNGESTTTLKVGTVAATQAAYLQVNDIAEVLQVPADVYQVFSRSADDYRVRQIFTNTVRAKLTGAENTDPLRTNPSANLPQALPSNDIVELSVRGPEGSYTLKRTKPNPEPRRNPDNTNTGPTLFVSQLVDCWELVEPSRDRLDPVKLRLILTTVANLWVESFERPQVRLQIANAFFQVPTGPDWLAVVREFQGSAVAEKQLAALTGLRDASIETSLLPIGAIGSPSIFAPAIIAAINEFPTERAITLTAQGQPPLTLQIGAVNRTTTRVEPPGPPMGPIPPMPRTITEEYRFAKFAGSPEIFETRIPFLSDVFMPASSLQDSLVARFETADVQSVQIEYRPDYQWLSSALGGLFEPTVTPEMTQPQTLTLMKKKGNPYAEKDADKQDRWYIGDSLADEALVTELLAQLAGLERSSEPAPLSTVAQTPAVMAQATITVQPKVAEGDTPLPAKVLSIDFRKVPGGDQLLVQLQGWPREDRTPRDILANLQRTSFQYLSKKLFDTAEAELTQLAISGSSTLALDLVADKWRMTAPTNQDADSTQAKTIIDALSGLEVSEYITAKPTATQLETEYGLANPKLSVALTFTGKAPRQTQLQIGNERGTPKGQYFARLSDRPGVFTISQSVLDQIQTSPLALLPSTLWVFAPGQIQSVEFERSTPAKPEKYQLSQTAGTWKVTGPFDASVSQELIQQLLPTITSLTVDQYVALKADPNVHGLSPAAHIVRIKTNKTAEGAPQEKVLWIGSATTDGMGQYAQIAGEGQPVFVLPQASYTAFNHGPLHWLSRDLLNVDPLSLTQVELIASKPEDNITLTRVPGQEWQPKDATFPLDVAIVNELTQDAAQPNVVRLADYGPNIDWKTYGLDAPIMTVKVTGTTTHTIQLGKEELTGEQYIRVDNGPAVGVISGATSANLTRSKLNLMDRNLLQFDPLELTDIIRKTGDKELALTQTGIRWEGVQPTKFRADTLTLETLAEQLARLRVNRVAAFDPKELKPFGLDTPVATITLKVGITSPKDLVLRIGQPVDAKKPNGERYAMLAPPGVPIIGVISDELANRLLAEPLKFQDKSLAEKFIDADKIELQRGDRKLTLIKESGTWKLTAPLAADAEQTEIEELVNALANLRADELVAEKPTDLKPYGLDEPQLTMKLSRGTQSVLDLSIGKLDSATNRVYAKTSNSAMVGLLDGTLTRRVLGEFRKRAVWSGVDASQIQTFTVSTATGNFVFRKVGANWVDPTKPNDVLDADAINDTLATLAQLQVERFAVDQKADGKLFGLDKPSQVIVLASGMGQAFTLQLGGEVGGTNGKQVYVRIPSEDNYAVGILSEANTAKIRRPRTEYLQKK